MTVNRVCSPTLLPTSTLYHGCPRGVHPHTVANFYLVSWLSKGCTAPHCCQLLPCILAVHGVCSPTLLPTSTLYHGCPRGVQPHTVSNFYLVSLLSKGCAAPHCCQLLPCIFAVHGVCSPTLLPTSTLYHGCPRGVQPHTVANFYLESWLPMGCASPHCCQLLPCIFAVHGVCSPTLLPTSTLYHGCPWGVQPHTVANFYLLPLLSMGCASPHCCQLLSCIFAVHGVCSPTLLPTSILYIGCPQGVQLHTVANFYLLSWLSKGCAAPHCCQLLLCILAVHRVCRPKLLPTSTWRLRQNSQLFLS